MLPYEKNSFRQVCDKPCANPILYTEWSPVRDLIAVITANGEIRLHRMHWQKVWVLPVKDKKATCLSWNPDGRTIAVGFDDGTVSIIEIEKAKTVHSLQCNSKISSIQWNKQDANELYLSYKEGITGYLPLFQKEEVLQAMQKINLVLSDADLVILSIGTCDGSLYVYIDGVFLIVKITKDKLGSENETYKVIRTNLLIDQGIIMLVCQGSDDHKYYFYNFHSQLLSSRVKELKFLSQKYLKCTHIFARCQECFQQMSDTSDDVHIKIMSKLESLEKLLEPNNSTIAYEFTMAYATGKSSPEMQSFFTQVLTTKTLSQLAQSVRLSYTSLDCEIKDQLDLYMQHLIFHVTEIGGLAKWYEKFGVLGLSLDIVNTTLVSLTQVCMKVKQLKFLIKNDMKYFNVFFTWLTDFIHESSSETNPNAATTFDNVDYEIMLDFLENRLQKNLYRSYNFEQVNQFFKDKNVDEVNTNETEWQTFVSENKILEDCSLIIKPDNQSSLYQLMLKLDKLFKSMFQNITETLSNSVDLLFSTCLFTRVDDHSPECRSDFHFLNLKDYNLINITPCSCDASHSFILKFYTEPRLECYSFSLEKQDSTVDESCIDVFYTIRDVKFYDNETLTVLFDEEDQSTKKSVSCLSQLPINVILKHPILVNPDMKEGILEKETLSIPKEYVLDSIIEQRRMESFTGKIVSVNGYSRQVSIVVSVSGRRIRVFDMTAEDDLDDTKDESKIANETTEVVEDDKDI